MMKKIIVTGKVLTVPAGSLVCLTEEQAKARKYALKLVDEDIFEVLKPIDFKHDEVLFVEMAATKNLMAAYEEIGEDETEEKAEDIKTLEQNLELTNNADLPPFGPAEPAEDLTGGDVKLDQQPEAKKEKKAGGKKK